MVYITKYITVYRVNIKFKKLTRYKRARYKLGRYPNTNKKIIKLCENNE